MIGVDVNEVFTASTMYPVPPFAVGERAKGDGGDEWIYVQADGAITAAGYVVKIDETFQAALVTTSNDDEGDLVGVANDAFADNDFGWVQIKGACVIRVAASAAANTELNTTATGGQLDDDATVTARKIRGAYLTTANGGAAATAAGYLHYPYVGPLVAAAGVFTTLTASGNVALGDTTSDTLAFYNGTGITQRAGGAQATSAVGTASSADVTTELKAAVIEIMNTLANLGLWKGAA
jgi:hypothetical protein